MVRKAREQLGIEGKKYGAARIGFMSEVPAAAVSIRTSLLWKQLISCQSAPTIWCST